MAFCQLMNIALDWSYELAGDIQKWIRPVNGGLEVLEIEQKNQNTFESEHYNINSNSGVKRKKKTKWLSKKYKYFRY